MLTRKQRDLLTFIEAEMHAGRRPTYRAMKLHLGRKSEGCVYAMVNCLIARGHLHRESRQLQLGQRVMWLRFDDNTQTLVPFTTRKAA